MHAGEVKKGRGQRAQGGKIPAITVETSKLAGCLLYTSHELSYSPLNNVYTDSKVFETVEAMLTDPKVDANRFRQIGRYQ